MMQASARAGHPLNGCYSHLFRCVAATMLCVLMATAALAGLLRHCVGQDGHHGIEIAHAGDLAHTNRAAFRYQDFARAGEKIDLGGRFCVDRLLFAEALRSSWHSTAAKIHRQPREPRVALASQATRKAKQDFISVAQSPTRRQNDFADPGLTALRTIVLLN
jgi:hypothetical protein